MLAQPRQARTVAQQQQVVIVAGAAVQALHVRQRVRLRRLVPLCYFDNLAPRLTPKCQYKPSTQGGHSKAVRNAILRCCHTSVAA